MIAMHLPSINLLASCSHLIGQSLVATVNYGERWDGRFEVVSSSARNRHVKSCVAMVLCKHPLLTTVFTTTAHFHCVVVYVATGLP